jgi:hypothetical protein
MLRARLITLLGLVATISGALAPYLDLLPPTWRTPLMLSGVLATACGPALFGPRGWKVPRRKQRVPHTPHSRSAQSDRTRAS